MSAELAIAENFDRTFKNYPFLFQTTKRLKSSSKAWPKYVSRNFNLIPQKIDAMLNATSIHDYVLNFSEINSLSKIKNRSLSSPTIEISNDMQFYSAGRITQKLLNPLKDAIIIEDSAIEVDSVQFSLFIEQLVINFGIELCIAISELVEQKRSLHNKNEFLERVEFSLKDQKNNSLKMTKKEHKNASIEQGQRLYPKVWELYTDNKKLLHCLRQHTDALQTVVLLEPYFAQTNTFHRIFSQIPIPTTQRFSFIQNLFLNLNKLKLPLANKKVICRALLILRTFNSDIFKSESKIHELIVPALNHSHIFEKKYSRPTLQRAYFATMRNH